MVIPDAADTTLGSVRVMTEWEPDQTLGAFRCTPTA